MTAPNWSPEPWSVDARDPDLIRDAKGIAIIGACINGRMLPARKACMERAASCVSACHGIADPAQAIALAREALEGMVEHDGSDCGAWCDRLHEKVDAALAALGAK